MLDRGGLTASPCWLVMYSTLRVGLFRSYGVFDRPTGAVCSEQYADSISMTIRSITFDINRQIRNGSEFIEFLYLEFFRHGETSAFLKCFFIIM